MPSSEALPINELVLERGDSGLGFNIRGGVDIPHAPGDPGIFITRIKEDGSAFRDGRLKVGDKILEVNGKSIERVTHNEAVQIFITAGNTVRMKVQHGAYDYIMKEANNTNAGSAQSNYKKIVIISLAVLVIAAGAIVVTRYKMQA